MTPTEATEYWQRLNATPLPPPLRPFTVEDQLAIISKCESSDVTGKQYLDFIQSLRIETGHPSNAELFDQSHLMSAVELDRRAAEWKKHPPESSHRQVQNG